MKRMLVLSLVLLLGLSIAAFAGDCLDFDYHDFVTVVCDAGTCDSHREELFNYNCDHDEFCSSSEKCKRVDESPGQIYVIYWEDKSAPCIYPSDCTDWQYVGILYWPYDCECQ